MTESDPGIEALAEEVIARMPDESPEWWAAWLAASSASIEEPK